jgi:hypothetical protein
MKPIAILHEGTDNRESRKAPDFDKIQTLRD